MRRTGSMMRARWLVLVLAIVTTLNALAQDGAVAEVEALSQKMSQLVSEGRYAQATPIAERLLALRESTSGEKSADTAGALNNLAFLYRYTGEFARAEALYLRAIAINEAVRRDDPEAANTLSNLATLYVLTGKYSEAERLFRRAVTLDEQLLGPEAPQLASALNNLAALYRTTRAPTKAEPLFLRALSIWEKSEGRESPNAIPALTGLGQLYFDSGQYSKAEPFMRRALAIAEKSRGPSHPDTATALNNLAGLYEARADHSNAEVLYRRAVDIRERVLGPSHPATAVAVSNLAGVFDSTGRYAEAEPLYQRALDILERVNGPDHTDTSTALNNLANLYRMTGAYGKAEPLLVRALSINEKALGHEHPATAAALANLGEIYRAEKAYAKAEPLLVRALAIMERNGLADHPDTTSILDSLAKTYGANSSTFAKAEPLLQRAAQINERSLGPDHPQTASALNGLAMFYASQGAIAQAEPLYVRALAVQERALGAQHPDVGDTLSNLGDLYWVAGVYGKAEPLLKRALAIEERNTARFLIVGSEARKAAFIRSRTPAVQRDVSFALAHPTIDSKNLGLEAILQYKGRVLDAMSDNITQLRRTASANEVALLEELSRVTEQLASLTLRGPGDGAAASYRSQLEALVAKQDVLEANLATRSVSLSRGLKPITLEDVRQALPRDTALVEWFRFRSYDPRASGAARWGELRYLAFVLKSSGEPALTDLGPAEPIDQLVARFRERLADEQSDDVKEVSAELAAKVIWPLQSLLGTTQKVLLSPDAALNLVPFAALVDQRAEYLLKRWEFTYLTSGRDLLRMRDPAPARSPAVIVADPDFGPTRRFESLAAAGSPQRSVELDRSGLQFKRLAGTAAEARAFQEIFASPRENVLTGERATEASMRALQGPDILHVATHGFFLSDQDAISDAAADVRSSGLPVPFAENPLFRSGLALAGANTRRSGPDDGILTAAEVARLDLVGTELVVLSACDTGVGTVRTGEGVYGLRRALTLAGAQAQLTSLWSVDDRATQHLMQRYYERLLKGEGRSAALRNTQLEMMTRESTQHPHYWAAFIPIGNGQPLRGRAPPGQ